jgi:hypothetical protein
LSAFASEKHFCSWLGLCPDNRISGGKVLSSQTRRVINRLADVLRMSATTLKHSQTALGACYRRMIAKLGPAQGITAVAHKLARLLYSFIKHGHEYVRTGLEQYEKINADGKMKALRKMAASMGVQISEPQTPCKRSFLEEGGSALFSLQCSGAVGSGTIASSPIDKTIDPNSRRMLICIPWGGGAATHP